jgi:hypothetical protein
MRLLDVRANDYKWGCPDLDRGLRLPKPVGYQATPHPLGPTFSLSLNPFLG